MFLRTTQGHSYNYISVYLPFPGINYSETIKYSYTLFQKSFIRYVPQQEGILASSLVFQQWTWAVGTVAWHSLLLAGIERKASVAQGFSWLCAGCYGAQGLKPGTDHKQVADLVSEVMKGCQMLLNLTGLYFNNCKGDPGLEPQSTRVLGPSAHRLGTIRSLAGDNTWGFWTLCLELDR